MITEVDNWRLIGMLAQSRQSSLCGRNQIWNSYDMAQNQRRRQKALARKAAKRKVRRKGIASNSSMSGGPSLSGVGKWPLLECLISTNWRDTESLCQILIARQAPTGEVGAGVFLVDLSCLGLKNGFMSRFDSSSEYRSALRNSMFEREVLVSCDITLAAKVLDEGVRYAKQLGFAPDKDGRQALRILADTDPGECLEDISLGGADGKPFFCAGPHDNVPRIMATLERSVGKDGFHFLLPAGPPPNDWFE